MDEKTIFTDTSSSPKVINPYIFNFVRNIAKLWNPIGSWQINSRGPFELAYFKTYANK